MKPGVKTVLVLVAIGLISSVSISLMARYSYPLIAKNQEEALQKAILEVLPDAERYEVVDEERKVYQGIATNGDVAGFAFVGKGGGYQGIISMMIGVSPDWNSIRGIIVLDSVETPGLGSKIADAMFRDQFNNMTLQFPIEYILNKPPEKPYQIQAITGATISSRAFVNIVNSSTKELAAIYAKDEQ